MKFSYYIFRPIHIFKNLKIMAWFTNQGLVSVFVFQSFTASLLTRSLKMQNPTHTVQADVSLPTAFNLSATTLAEGMSVNYPCLVLGTCCLW